MSLDLITLDRPDPDPVGARPIAAIALIPAADRAAHAADAHRCCCWTADRSWRGAVAGGRARAIHEGRRAGVIGHYAAADAASGQTLLRAGVRRARSRGSGARAVGPMDGTTWRRYRFIVDRGTEPPFFLEPDNPGRLAGALDECAGSAPIANLHVGAERRPGRRRSADDAALDRLRQAGITIRHARRPARPGRAASHLRAVARRVQPELSLHADRRGRNSWRSTRRCCRTSARSWCCSLRRTRSWSGSCSRVPDLLEGRRTGVRSIRSFSRPLRSIRPWRHGSRRRADGPGAAQGARDLGFRRAIHALIHESNVSRPDQRPLRADVPALRALRRDR